MVIDKVDIQFDTTALLNGMIQQASRVVAAVVHMANTASIVPESRLPRSASFLAMPPPSQHCTSSPDQYDRDDVDDDGRREHLLIEEDCLPANKQVMHYDRDKKLSQTRSSSTILSSDGTKPLNLAAAKNSAHLPNTCVARFEPVTDDEEASGDHWTIPPLSPDECENIVDKVFGGLDDNILNCYHASILHPVSPRLSFLPPRKKHKTINDATAFAY